MSERPAFDEVGEQFLQTYDTVRGYVRQELVRRNMLASLGELSEPGLNIVDVGGGDGRDAMWLSERGHAVTVIDTSCDMLAKAQARLETTDSDVQSRVTLQHGTVHSLRDTYRGQFDIALSHGVLMYLDDPGQHVHDLMDITKTTGKMSVMTRGYAATEQRLLIENNLAGVQCLASTGVYVNHLDVDTHPYKPEELVGLFQKSGLNVQDWFGVRLLSDDLYIPLSEIDPMDVRALLDREAELGKDSSHKGMGQMLQFMVRKIPPNLEPPILNERGYAVYR